jgi:hypothetical protein
VSARTTRPQHRGTGRSAALATASVVAAVAAAAATAHADPNGDFKFQTPSGNIACYLGPAATGGTEGSVSCDIAEHTYVAPARPSTCHLGWGDRFELSQGNAPTLSCHGDTLRTGNLKSLDYGETAFTGAIRCLVEPTGITCTDSTTGHLFRVSMESYELH